MSTSVPAPAPPSPTRGALVRLLPNLIWEAVLLVLVVLVAVAASTAEDRYFAPIVWYQLATLGLLASAFALSLRTATPNLAVPTLSVAAGVWFVDLVNGGMAPAAATVVVVLYCAAIGLVLGLLTGLTSIPGWAVSFAAIAVVQGGMFTAYGATVTPLRNRDALLRADGYWPWLILAGVLSIGGGLLFAVPAIRRFLGANRPDPSRPDPNRPDPTAFRLVKLPGALVGMVGSAAIAGLAGAVLVRYTAGASATVVDGMQMPTLVAIALLGGVSVFGVRAGIAGTFLAAMLFVFVRHWMLLNRVETSMILVVVGIAVVLGVLVNWLLELIGRRLDRPATSPPGTTPAPTTPGWPSDSPTQPAQPWVAPPQPAQPWVAQPQPAQPWTPPTSPAPPQQPWPPPPGQ